MNSQLTPESRDRLGVISNLFSTLPAGDALTLRNRVADLLDNAKIEMTADSIGLQISDDLLAEMNGSVSPP